MALILDGKKVSVEIEVLLREKISKFAQKPCLAIIQVGDRAESNAYVARKKKFADDIGALVMHVRLAESAQEDEIAARIDGLCADSTVHGILLQLPIPESLNGQRLIDRIAPQKDVDGLTQTNVSLRQQGKTAIIPATARGAVALLERYRIPIAGRKVAVLGRSSLVGAPTADFLRQKGATVTVCHSRTQNTADITKANDIIVVAIGKPKFIGKEYFRNDRTQSVIDVGITAVRKDGAHHLDEELPATTLCGDVDFHEVEHMVAAISPVPGGVGPMTVASLFENLVESYEKQL